MVLKKTLCFLIILISFAWFPHSLQNNIDLGYCWDIYYEAGRGNFTEGWLYNDAVGFIFKPFAEFSYPVAFGIWYSLGVMVWLSFMWHYPIVGLMAFYPILLALEIGQIDPVLAWLCLTPLGSVLAACIKPYCLLFVVFHAWRIKKGNSAKLL